MDEQKLPDASMLGYSRPSSSVHPYRLVFVYGTLKSTECNSWILQQQRGGDSVGGILLATARTCRKYPLVLATSFTAPFLVDAEGYGEFVEGEIHAVHNETINFLDEFEGHPDFYQRRFEMFEVLENKLDEASDSARSILRLEHLSLKSGDLVESEAYFLRHNKLYFAQRKPAMRVFTSAHAKQHGKFDADAHLATVQRTDKIMKQQQPPNTTDETLAELTLPPEGTTMDKEELEVDTLMRKVIEKFWDNKRRTLAKQLITEAQAKP